MSLVTVIVVLVLAGVVMWAINSYLPMEANIKKLLNIAVVVILVLWLLSAFGILGDLSTVRVGR